MSDAPETTTGPAKSLRELVLAGHTIGIRRTLASQLDYILLTPKLSAASPKPPHVERRGLVKKQHMSVSMAKLDDTPGAAAALPSQRFAGVTNKMSASDHCPVVMELNV